MRACESDNLRTFAAIEAELHFEILTSSSVYVCSRLIFNSHYDNIAQVAVGWVVQWKKYDSAEPYIMKL